jgi:uncharacterized protein
MSNEHSRRKFLAASMTGAGLAALGATDTVQAAETSTMPLRPLGKTGRMISIVGFGGGSRYNLQDNEAEAEQMIHRAVELGINYFDTAHSYTLGEHRLSMQRYGKWLTPNYRNQITLSTKLQARDAEGAKKQFDECLTDLKTDHVDILHFHGVGSTEEVDQIIAKDGALKMYRKWQEEGVIKYIGVTNHDNGDVLVDAMKRIKPDVVMCPQNPGHGSGNQNGVDFAGKVIPYALAHGIGMMGMKITAQNKLIGKGGITAEELVRYALTLPVAAMIIGMPTLEVVESNAHIARTLKPMTEQERLAAQKKLMAVDMRKTAPYLAAGYVDGQTHA